MKTIEEYKVRYPDLFKSAQMYLPEGWDGIFMDFLATCSRWLHYPSPDSKGQTHLDSIRILQVKEKFGELRIYFNAVGEEDSGKPPLKGTYSYVQGAADYACTRSLKTCQVCGKPGTLGEYNGWLQVVCEEHAPEDKGYDDWFDEEDEP